MHVLRLPDGPIGKIIQTFKNTVYVRTDDDNLICITTYDVKGPVNINLLNDTDLTTIQPGDLVYKAKGSLKVRGWVLPISTRCVYCSKRELGPVGDFRERSLSAASFLLIMAPEGSILDHNSPFFTTFSENIRQIVTYSRRADRMGLQNVISKLVGLGGGSTPSGDDFLAGFLFCLRQLASPKGNMSTTFDINNKTSWYSRKFIEYAQQGFVIQPLEDYTSAVLSGTEEIVTTSMLDLAEVGHSSGIDSAVGVLIATTFGKDDRYCNSLLKKLSLCS